MDPHAGQPIATAGVALGEGDGVAIMIHGRGAEPRNILDLASRLDRPRWTYLAPAAADRTWYPYSFMADTASNEPYLSSALAAVDRVFAHVESRGIPRTRIVLIGFSQGACLSSEYAVRHAARYGGIAVLTGGLIGPPGTTWAEHGSFAGTPIFLGSSDVDAHVPKDRVDETATVFERMGATVDERIYPGMGHLVNDDEIAAVRAILDGVAAGT